MLGRIGRGSISPPIRRLCFSVALDPSVRGKETVMAHVPPHLARLAGAPPRSRPTRPKHRAGGEDVPGHETQSSVPEVTNGRRPHPIRGLGLRLVARIARAAGRLVIVR